MWHTHLHILNVKCSYFSPAAPAVKWNSSWAPTFPSPTKARGSECQLHCTSLKIVWSNFYLFTGNWRSTRGKKIVPVDIFKPGTGALRGCGLSILGNAQNTMRQGPKHPWPNLVLFWAGSWTIRPPESFPASNNLEVHLYRLTQDGGRRTDKWFFFFLCPSQTRAAFQRLNSELGTPLTPD